MCSVLQPFRGLLIDFEGLDGWQEECVYLSIAPTRGCGEQLQLWGPTMRRVSSIRVFLGAAAVILLLGVQVPARADSTTYTFTGLDGFSGTNFAYVSPLGFLSFFPCDITGFPVQPACQAAFLTPTMAGDVIFVGKDVGAMKGFAFFSLPSGVDLIVFETPGGGEAASDGLNPFSLNTLGPQTLTDKFGAAVGTLNVAATATPEPSSFI